MIQLSLISQTKYIINNDTIIGYTSAENRSIALLFIDGEKYEELYLNSIEISNHKDSIINIQKYQIQFLDSTIVIQTKFLRDINKEYVFNQEELNKAIKKNNNKNKIIGGSIIANIILIISLIIK